MGIRQQSIAIALFISMSSLFCEEAQSIGNDCITTHGAGNARSKAIIEDEVTSGKLTEDGARQATTQREIGYRNAVNECMGVTPQENPAPNTPQEAAKKKPAAGKKAAVEDPKRRACINRTVQLANNCNSQKQTTTNSCDASQDSQLKALDQEGQQLSNNMQTQENNNAVCQQTSGYQSRLQNALSQYSNRCQGAVSSCQNACNQAAESGKECGDAAEVRSALSAVQQANSTCSSLLNKAQQAAQQKQGQSQTVADANKCNQTTTAASTPQSNGNGPLSQTPAQSVTTGTMPGMGDGTNGMSTGDSTPSSSAYIPAASSSPSQGLSDESDDSNSPTSQRGYGAGTGGLDGGGGYGGGGYGSGNQLASLPSRQPTTAADDGNDKERKMGNAQVLSGTSGGSGGRSFRFNNGNKNAAAFKDFDASEFEDKAKAANTPDLSQFLPKEQQRSLAAEAAVRGGKYSNFFEAIKERYFAKQPTLYQPADNP